MSSVHERVPKSEPNPAISGFPVPMVVSHGLPDITPAHPIPSSSLEHLTRDMKNLVKKIQDLSHLGIEDSKIMLPKICVVGDQSTGKSSLIEGISEIKVPRSEGTCTRCPLEINLSESDDAWKCVIHLSRRYVFDPSKRLKVPKKSQPLGPWIAIGGQDDEHFVTLDNKQEVERAIGCAQLAILNPSTDPQDFVPGTMADMSHIPQVKFSPNAVRLDISGPSLPNLSFYDLPGVISQTEQDNERYLVNLVENLVKDYVSQEHCIVLLTLTMTDDATNSSAARLVRDIKGAKERTLGVLTKPDRLPPDGRFDLWGEILDGSKFKLGHGYYVIRNNTDPLVSHAQARKEEETFFNSSLWTRDLAAFEDRFGTRQLQMALSDLLMRQILGSLPSIIAQIDEKSKAIDAELKTLPNPPTEDVQRILWGKTSDLERKIHELFDGTPSIEHNASQRKPMQEQWNKIVMDLQMALAKTRPILDVASQKDNEDLAEVVDSDCEMAIVGVAISTPKKRKSPAGGTSTSEPATPRKTVYSTSHFEGSKSTRITLQQLTELKIRSNTVGVPNQLDPRAIENLNKRSVEHWGKLMEIFLKATHNLVHSMLVEALEEEFAQYHQTGLYQELKRILKEFMSKLRQVHLQITKDYCKSEHEIPFTMAQGQHQVLMQQASNALRTRRHNARASTWLKIRGHDMSDERISDKIKKIQPEQLIPDRYSQEIEMMASSLAYYDIASSRFLDVLCQSTHMKLFRACRGGLVNTLRDDLEIFGDNGRARCLDLMTEDPERQHRRAQLQKEREKFSKAQEWLDSVRDEDMEMEDVDQTDLADIKDDWSL
ncbi:Dynamin [Penicillium cf. griseofulvum]|uniref:Dynamin n=1 Tax=Penicillium cf. griseofulvum TaxID=2972120 RepID=A0A9W9M5E3_9EURO|nr:Dynamin [Penicillium cf. griseofulvum]KAJ5435137.1 Dynamin [Penicillium cf. griseofulvum]KAJ5452969.1 Dynamin [Penicillium cf. griseofulvum]